MPRLALPTSTACSGLSPPKTAPCLAPLSSAGASPRDLRYAVKIIKSIDKLLGDHPLWERKEIYSQEKLIGFSYKSSVCEFKIQNPLRTADIEMIEVKDAERFKTWQEFAKKLVSQGDEGCVKIIPKEVFQAISLLCIDNSGSYDRIAMENKSDEVILFKFKSLFELCIEKKHHPFKPPVPEEI